ncbi:unnamed protein product [Linum trigynum]|uniref:Uncharacterized protein n=1 Tax=Linum trigynum TaxID=586398 RepID=A0AAV2G3C8_9ROSI
MTRCVLSCTARMVICTAVHPGRASRDFLVLSQIPNQRRGELGFWIPNTQGTNPRERGRFEGILGVEKEDFFALEARGTSPDLKTDHLKILTAVSLFSME